MKTKWAILLSFLFTFTFASHVQAMEENKFYFDQELHDRVHIVVFNALFLSNVNTDAELSVLESIAANAIATDFNVQKFDFKWDLSRAPYLSIEEMNRGYFLLDTAYLNVVGASSNSVWNREAYVQRHFMRIRQAAQNAIFDFLYYNF